MGMVDFFMKKKSILLISVGLLAGMAAPLAFAASAQEEESVEEAAMGLEYLYGKYRVDADTGQAGYEIYADFDALKDYLVYAGTAIDQNSADIALNQSSTLEELGALESSLKADISTLSSTTEASLSELKQNMESSDLALQDNIDTLQSSTEANLSGLRSDMEEADSFLQDQVDGIKANYVTGTYDANTNTVSLTLVSDTE